MGGWVDGQVPSWHQSKGHQEGSSEGEELDTNEKHGKIWIKEMLIFARISAFCFMVPDVVSKEHGE